MEDHEKDNFESLNKNEEQAEAPKPEAEKPEEKSEKKPEDKEEIKKELESEKPVETAPVIVTESIVSSEKYEKKKTGEFPKIMAAFFFLATAGLGGFLVYHYMTFDHNPKAPEKADEPVIEQKEEKTEKKDEDGNTVTSTTVSSTIVSSDADDLAVRNVVADVKNAINDATNTKLGRYYSFTNTYDSGAPLIKLAEAKVPLRALKSYGLYAPISEFNITGGGGFDDESVINKAIVDKLTELGFSKNGEIAEFTVVTGGIHYTNEQTGVTCSFTSQALPVGFNCSHKSWVSSDTVKIANQLADAYYKKEGAYPITIGAQNYTIKDSPVSPYQTLRTAVSNGLGLFYRVNKEADWQFFTGTQAVLGCEEFNTKDLRNAFVGETCWDDTLEGNTTVKAWEE